IKNVNNTETTKNTCAYVRVGYTWTAQTQCMVYTVYTRVFYCENYERVNYCNK
ncbi:unnamed protein product, partial [Arabidopsis halleri]